MLGISFDLNLIRSSNNRLRTYVVVEDSLDIKEGTHSMVFMYKSSRRGLPPAEMFF